MGEEGEGCEPLTSDESDESDASACWRRRVVGILEPAEWLLARLRVGSLAEMEEARRRSDARPALANSILETKLRALLVQLSPPTPRSVVCKWCDGICGGPLNHKSARSFAAVGGPARRGRGGDGGTHRRARSRYTWPWWRPHTCSSNPRCTSSKAGAYWEHPRNPTD